jgi:hypothetical protein
VLRTRQPCRAAFDRDYGWQEEGITTHYLGDDSEVPVLAAGATKGKAGSGRWVNREVLRLAVATLPVRRDQHEES